MSFATDIQPIFTSRCAGCHGGARPAGSLPLGAGQSYNALVNQTSGCGGQILVKPGDAPNSYLYKKLVGGGICGNVMPSGPGSLPQADIDKIRRWICQGAKNN